MDGYEKRMNVADLASDIILKTNGTITIEELLDQLCVSRRHLEKKIYRKSGLRLSNIVVSSEWRIYQILLLTTKVSIGMIWFIKGGFHDQNHFIKDFKALNTLSPAKYHQEHSELIRLLHTSKIIGRILDYVRIFAQPSFVKKTKP